MKVELKEIYWCHGRECTREEKSRILDEDCAAVCNKCKKPEPVDNFIGSVNFSGDYHISPEAGDLTYVFDDVDNVVSDEEFLINRRRNAIRHSAVINSVKKRKGKK